MKRTAILRFRDLVTEDDGTIQEHAQLLRTFGEVWWGWWMRQYETPPRTFLAEMASMISAERALTVYLFNSGKTQLFQADVAQILVAPPGSRLPTPDPERSPTYYHRGQYPAWFLLRSMKEVDFSNLRLYYDAFPTRPELAPSLTGLLRQQVTSLEQLRHIDVTMWAVSVDE